MAQRVVGGIYYFHAWQSVTQQFQFKSYVYLTEMDEIIILVKINSNSFSHIPEVKIFCSDYPAVNVIMYDCYLDCGRLIKDAISPESFDQLSDDTFRGFIRVDDLREMIKAFNRSRTISPIERQILTNTIEKRILELQE